MPMKVSDDDFIRAINEHGVTRGARILGLDVSSTAKRRRHLEKKYDAQIGIKKSPTGSAIIEHTIRDGTILVGSDAHIWPGDRTVAQRAFIAFAKEFKPSVIVANGDFFDGATISRHPSIGWEDKPTLKDELEAVQDYMHELTQASKNSIRIWPAGNHDLRFESRLAAVAPEYRGLKGIHLKDHFPAWKPCWRLDVNGNLAIKHKFSGGEHAPHNNAVKSGWSMVTGHLHSQKVDPWTDFNGTRYGVDSGCLAEPHDSQFIHYTEANPLNWRSGFCLLSFIGGRLLEPELIKKWDDDHVEFRGGLISV